MEACAVSDCPVKTWLRQRSLQPFFLRNQLSQLLQSSGSDRLRDC